MACTSSVDEFTKQKNTTIIDSQLSSFSCKDFQDYLSNVKEMTCDDFFVEANKDEYGYGTMYFLKNKVHDSLKDWYFDFLEPEACKKEQLDLFMQRYIDDMKSCCTIGSMESILVDDTSDIPGYKGSDSGDGVGGNKIPLPLILGLVVVGICIVLGIIIAVFAS